MELSNKMTECMQISVGKKTGYVCSKCNQGVQLKCIELAKIECKIESFHDKLKSINKKSLTINI